MIITINWNEFVAKGYLSNGPVYIQEDEEKWEMFTHDGIFVVKAVVEKHENVERNIMFVDRFFMGRTNVTRAITIEQFGPKPTHPEPQIAETTADENVEEKTNAQVQLSEDEIEPKAEPNPAIADEANRIEPYSGDLLEDDEPGMAVIPTKEAIQAQADLTRERANYNAYTVNKAEEEEEKGEAEDYVEDPTFSHSYIDTRPKFNELNNKETDNKERFTTREEE